MTTFFPVKNNCLVKETRRKIPVINFTTAGTTTAEEKFFFWCGARGGGILVGLRHSIFPLPLFVWLD